MATFCLRGFCERCGLRVAGPAYTPAFGDLHGRNFLHTADGDRRVALGFVQRLDVDVRSWYRSARNATSWSEGHLRVWTV